jgi:hypothetical protein
MLCRIARLAGCALLLASPVLVVAACSSQTTCTLVGCETGASWQRTLSVPSAQIPSLQVTVCRNGACDSGGVTQTGDPSTGFACAFGGPLQLQARCGIAVTSNGAVTLTAYVTVDERAATDGDLYELRVVQPGAGTPVLDAKDTARYTTSQPNGPACAPTCKEATL